MLWGLSYAGEKGARAVLEMMRREIDQAFALAGIFHIYYFIIELKHVIFEIFLLNNLYFFNCRLLKRRASDERHGSTRILLQSTMIDQNSNL